MLVVSSGLAQYSGDPKTEWHLDAHQTREALLEAVANLPYKGGNTLTGTSTCSSNALAGGAVPSPLQQNSFSTMSFFSFTTKTCHNHNVCLLQAWL